MSIDNRNTMKRERANRIRNRRRMDNYSRELNEVLLGEFMGGNYPHRPAMAAHSEQTIVFRECEIPWLPYVLTERNAVNGNNQVGANVGKRKTTVQLTRENFQTILESTELVLVYFYVKWNRLCETTTVLFDEATNVVRKKFPNEEQVVMGRVNCDTDGAVASDFVIREYPIIKVFRNGQPLRGQYTGSYLATEFDEYITKELQNPIKTCSDPSELMNANNNRKKIIAYFDNENQFECDIFRRVAHNLKTYGDFYVKFDSENDPNQTFDQPVVKFIPENASPCDSEEIFSGNIRDYKKLDMWAHKKLVVREMTAENFEELRGGPYPLLILYYNPNNCSSVVKKFKDIIGENLMNRKHQVDFAVANALEFPDCMQKYKKEESDLPLVAIEDSKNNMFLFPYRINHTFPQRLLEFFNDYDIGKLQYLARTGGVWSVLTAYCEDPREKLDYVY